jgi:hypothetical protein
VKVTGGGGAHAARRRAPAHGRRGERGVARGGEVECGAGAGAGAGAGGGDGEGPGARVRANS